MPPKQVCEVAGACSDGPVHAALLQTEPSDTLRADVAKLLADLGSVARAQVCDAPAAPLRQQLGVADSGPEAVATGGAAAAPQPSEACQICKVRVCLILL